MIIFLYYGIFMIHLLPVNHFLSTDLKMNISTLGHWMPIFHKLVPIVQWSCKTPISTIKKQLCSQRHVSVHVSLNDELLLTPPLSP